MIRTQYTPKHLLQIADTILDLGNDFTLIEDLGIIYKQLSFSLPDLSKIKIKNIDNGNIENITINNRTPIKLYFNFFNDQKDAENAEIKDMICIFEGLIASINDSENKQNGLTYNVNCFSSIYASFEYSMESPTYSGNINEFFSKVRKEYNIDLLYNKLNINVDDFIINIETDVNFGKALQKISNKYLLNIFQGRDNDLNIQYPLFFYKNTINTWDYDLEHDVFNINYGEQTNNYDSVIVFGLGNNIGLAFDPISYQLKNFKNLNPEDLKNEITPDTTKLNTYIMFERSISDTVTLNNIAQSKLLEFARNYVLELEVPFDPTQQIGDCIRIKNSSKINPEQIWIIKNRTIKISKNDISCVLKCFSNSISTLPGDLALKSHLYDIYYLEKKDKKETELILNG